MAIREEKIITGKIYHVFNKMIKPMREFEKSENCSHFLDLMKYYRSSKTTVRHSLLKDLDPRLLQPLITVIMTKKFFRVEILAFCLMPTHFHLLLKQQQDNGISKFVGDIVNAFTRYLNIKYERKGPIFLPKFKAVMIKSHEQLLHVTRYIHLNPYSSGLITDLEELVNYEWSSLKEYLTETENKLSETGLILSNFGNDSNRYKQFVLSNAEYQRTLELCKHSLEWEK